MADEKKKIFTPDNNKPKKKPAPKQPPIEQPDGFTPANQEPEKQPAEPEAQQPAPPDPREIIRQKQKDIKKGLKGMKKSLEIKLSGKKDDVKISKPNKEAPVSEKKNIKELDASTYHSASAKMSDSDKPNKSDRALELRLKGNRKDRKDLEKSWKKGFARGKSYSQMTKQGGLSYREETEIQEKAVSKQQQKFFGLVRAIQKGEASGSPEAEKAAKDMSKKDVKDYASTKHKGLPKKVQSESELNKRIKELKNKPVKEELPPHLAKHFDKKGNAIKGDWKDGKWKANKKQPDFKIKDVTPKGYGPADEACWTNYKQVGLKKKGKKMVPNCVPEETNEDVNVASSVFNKAKFVRSFKEMSADKAYKAMDKADKQSRGEMSVIDPKKAVKRRLQAKKFADYSIKKTLNKEEFNAVYEEALKENKMYDTHEEALQENMHRNLQTFGKELKAYSDKSGGIDKKYFNKIAQTALDGKMPAKSDVDGDTDPRDFVLGMMQRILGKPVMKNYKGISPAFEDNHKEVEKRVKMFKRLRDKKASQGYQKTDLANEGIIKKDWKPGTYHVKDADGKIHGTYKSGKHASKAMHKLMDKGAHKELEVSRADEAYDQDHADFYAGKDPKKKKMIVPPKDPKYKHGTGIDGQKGNTGTNEEAYDVKTAKTKYGKITVKSFDSHDDAKSHLASMNKKGHKGIISQGGKPVKEEKGFKIRDKNRGHGEDKVYKTRKDAEKAAKFKAAMTGGNYEVHEGDMKVPSYANRKTAQAEKKAREEAQRKRAGLDEAKKSDYELYHKDFSSAMQHAYEVAKKRGYIVDKDDIDNKVATGPRKPSSGKTNRYILGTDKKQNLHVQVANLDNKRYELNMYIEDVQQEDMVPVNKNEVKKKFRDRTNKDIDRDGDVDSSDKYLHKRRKAISKAMAKEHHEKDANGEPIPHDDAEGNDINEVESAYAKQIADYKKRGGTVKTHTGPDMKKVKRATAGFKKKLAKTNKIVAQELERERAEKEANRASNQEESYTTGSSDTDVLSALKLLSEKGKNQEIKEFANDTIKEYSTQKTFSEENIKRLNYYVNNNPYETGDQSKMTNKLYLMHQAKISNKLKGEERELKISELEKLAEQMGFTQAQYKKIFNKQGLYETKGLNKLNKVMSQRKVEEEYGAGEEGTDKLVKKYKKDTPGQGDGIKEATGHTAYDGRDPYRLFEKMFHFFVGSSIKDISDVTASVLDNYHNAIKLEDNRTGAFGIVKLDDAKQFYNNHEMDMEEFVSMVKDLGVTMIDDPDTDDTVIGHIKTKAFQAQVNEEAETEIDEKEKLDSNNETSSEIDPAMKKYSDFISFSTNYEKNGFYTNHFSELKNKE
tara:strand:- start:3745 stop:7773 length:4029 start_codon:yes stop_codon:yes gene_type:complete